MGRTDTWKWKQLILQKVTSSLSREKLKLLLSITQLLHLIAGEPLLAGAAAVGEVPAAGEHLRVQKPDVI